MKWRRPSGLVRLAIHTVVAAVLLVVAAVWRFDIPPRDMLLIFGVCVLGLALVIALAALAGWLLRRVRGNR